MLEKKWLIFGACNPMVDITANVTKKFLKRYELLPNDAIIGTDANVKIYDDMKSNYADTLTFTAGGSGYNTLRIASWILNIPNVNVFMGCVGRDEYADLIVSKADEAGLVTTLQTHETATTATCATLLTDQNRSMVAHLGAACEFTDNHLDHDENWNFIKNSQVFYITGFFFSTCMNAVTRIAKFCQENPSRLLCINLSALFMTQLFKKEFIQILPYVDILFGNDDEALSFGKNVLNIQTNDIKKIGMHISNMRKINTERKRLVVITRAANSVLYTNGKKMNEMEVPVIESSKIIDTSCAGDAFCGGFLSQLVKNESIEKCIDCGIWASGIIIQRHGCDYPAHINYV